MKVEELQQSVTASTAQESVTASDLLVLQLCSAILTLGDLRHSQSLSGLKVLLTAETLLEAWDLLEHIGNCD